MSFNFNWNEKKVLDVNETRINHHLNWKKRYFSLFSDGRSFVRVKIKSTWWKLCKSSLSDSFLSMKVRLGNENSFDEKHSLKNKKEGSYRRNSTDNFLYSTRTIPWKTEKEKYRANITDNAGALNFVGVVLFFGLSEIGWECQRFTQLRRTNEDIRTKISFTRISHWFSGKSSVPVEI